MVRKSSRLYETRSNKAKHYREIDPRLALQNLSSPYISNKVHPSEFTVWNLLPMTFYLEFRKLPYFWFLLVIILEMSFSFKDFSLRFYNLISFSILFASSLMQNLVSLWKSYKLGRKFNERKVKRWKNLSFETCPAKDIQVGDLVMVCKGEEVPADLLLLDCKGVKKAMFDESRNLGTKDYVEKTPVDSFKIIKELDHNEIFYSLTKLETINVTLPKPSFKDFKAKIRYKGDPKTYVGGLNNFVIGGSIVASNDWILGLVVYTGMESKFWLNSKPNKKRKMKYLAVTQNKIFSINFFIIIILIVISVSIGSTKSNHMFDFVFSDSIIWFIILYSNLISISYYVILMISRILSAIFMMLKNKKFEIDPMSLQELGRIEYLIVDKEDLIKHKNMKISSVFFKDLTFFRDEGIKKRYSVSDHDNLILTAGLSSDANKEYFCFENLKRFCTNEELKQEIFEYFSCALFTSLNLTVELQKPTKENEKIIKLCKTLGISIQQSSNEFCVLSFNKSDHDYLTIGGFKNTKKTFVIVTDTSQSKGTIYIKSDHRLHRTQSNQEESPSLFESNDFLARYKTYYYYKIDLNRDEIEQFIYDFKLASSSNLNSSGKLLNLFEGYSESPDFIGCINFQYKHHKSIRKTLTRIQRSGIKTWMVSGNKGRNALLAAYSSKLFRTQTNVRYLVGATDLSQALEAMKKVLSEEGEKEKESEKPTGVGNSVNLAAIKNNNNGGAKNVARETSPKSRRSIQTIRRNKTLHSLIIKNRVTSQEKTQSLPSLNISSSFSLVIDSEFLDFGFSTEESRKLLSLLFLLSDSICFYGLNPDQKRSIVKLLKKNFLHKPGIMAVGDIMCDSGMLDEADVSVLIEKARENNPYYNPSITVPKFSNLKKLILVDGHYSYVRLAKILHYCLFKESMICVLVLLQQINSGWSGSPIIDSNQFLVFELFVSLLPILVIGVLEKDCYEKDCKHKNELQSVSRFDELMSIPRLIYYMIFGAIQGIIILFICSSTFTGVINSQGHTEDTELRNSLTFLIISVSLLVKILLTTRHFYLPTIISPILSLFFILILVFYFSDNSESEEISRILSNQGLFWILGFTLPFLLLLNILFLTYCKKDYLDINIETVKILT